MDGYNISVSWQLIRNNHNSEKQFLAEFTIRNEGSSTIFGKDWKMFYNQTNRKITNGGLCNVANISLVRGDFYQLSFNRSFSLQPNAEIRIPYEGCAWLTRYSDAPSAPYFMFASQDGKEKLYQVKSYSIDSFDTKEQINRCNNDKTPISTPGRRFETNDYLKVIEKNTLPKIIPSPLSLMTFEGRCDLRTLKYIRAHKDLKNEAEYFSEELRRASTIALPLKYDDSSCVESCVELRIDSGRLVKADSYEIVVTRSSILIQGSSDAGVFYGIQSIIALIQNSTQKFFLSECRCFDRPRFSYRGFMVDVARNFQSKEVIFQLIDVMSMYKLNRLHMHLTDDEGWRLYIKQLPELTSFGSVRSHTLIEENHLQPSFGSGPTKENTFGTGFYSRKDFVDILSYAKSRHIQVVPEINIPGHARAAIKAMDYRYKKYIAVDNVHAAEEYLLSDRQDTSKYTSVQLYTDNVICVGRESVYKFYETVIDCIISMYDEAGTTLTTVHTGGDEVPKGVWKNSPECAKLIDADSEVSLEDQLLTYFMKRINKILKERNITTAGWEEVGIKRENKKSVPNRDLKNSDLCLYAWRNLSGSEDLAHRLANFGYDVILCNATHLYFDLAYDKDPNEPGLYWAGFVDTKKVYTFCPENTLLCTTHDIMGNGYDYKKDFKEHDKLHPEAVKRIKGIQGQLWGETITKSGMLNYYTLPRLLALAERAWAAKRSWETLENQDERETLIEHDWNRFANSIGHFEMNRLSKLGYSMRIPMPGACVKNGILYANIEFPGLEIRYTTDGSDPCEESNLYSEGLKVNGKIKVRAFNAFGHCSRVCTVE